MRTNNITHGRERRPLRTRASGRRLLRVPVGPLLQRLGRAAGRLVPALLQVIARLINQVRQVGASRAPIATLEAVEVGAPGPRDASCEVDVVHCVRRGQAGAHVAIAVPLIACGGVARCALGPEGEELRLEIGRAHLLDEGTPHPHLGAGERADAPLRAQLGRRTVRLGHRLLPARLLRLGIIVVGPTATLVLHRLPPRQHPARRGRRRRGHGRAPVARVAPHLRGPQSLEALLTQLYEAAHRAAHHL
mmetsp:Transcript_4903/g.12064  ORF Transcript_4903/g.12064 Transcript_4903/m.12064 type:complete len:248 (+) Transcript_4903:53-796(+)